MNTADKILLAMAADTDVTRAMLLKELCAELSVTLSTSTVGNQFLAVSEVAAHYVRTSLATQSTNVEQAVNHPKHYGGDVKFEVIKLIRDWGLGFALGNALKYICRAPRKGTEQLDITKALWYLNEAFSFEETAALDAPCKIGCHEACEYHKLPTGLRACVISFAYEELTQDAIFYLKEYMTERGWPIVG